MSSSIFLGSPFLHQASRQLTNDEILHLPSTGIALVPSAGPNRILLPTGATALTSFTGAYSASADATWGIYWESGILASDFTKVNGVLQSTANFLVQIGPLHDVTIDSGSFAFEVFNQQAIAPSNAVDNALVLADYWAGVSNYTGGNSANSMIVTISYYIFNTQIGAYETS